jgi:hypothetical protein
VAVGGQHTPQGLAQRSCSEDEKIHIVTLWKMVMKIIYKALIFTEHQSVCQRGRLDRSSFPGREVLCIKFSQLETGQDEFFSLPHPAI